MSQRSDDIPMYSCGKINLIIEAADRAERYFASCEDGLSDILESKMSEIKEHAESVRIINSELREAAETFADEADYFEAQTEEG